MMTFSSVNGNDRCSADDVFDLVYATRTEAVFRAEGMYLLGGLAGISYKTSHFPSTSSISCTCRMVRVLPRNSKLIIVTDAPGQSGYFALSDNLEYGQRSITNALLSGDHYPGRR